MLQSKDDKRQIPVNCSRCLSPFDLAVEGNFSDNTKLRYRCDKCEAQIEHYGSAFEHEQVAAEITFTPGYLESVKHQWERPVDQDDDEHDDAIEWLLWGIAMWSLVAIALMAAIVGILA
jgi:hypothetical protein